MITYTWTCQANFILYDNQILILTKYHFSLFILVKNSILVKNVIYFLFFFFIFWITDQNEESKNNHSNSWELQNFTSEDSKSLNGVFTTEGWLFQVSQRSLICLLYIRLSCFNQFDLSLEKKLERNDLVTKLAYWLGN